MATSRTPATPTTPTPTATTTDGDATEQAALLRVSVTRLARRLRQQSDAGLSPSQLSALTAITLHGTMTLGALADYERVAPPTITKVVAKLEAEGMVARHSDPHDKRISRVSVTPRGDDVLAELRRRKTAWLAGRIDQLSPTDRARVTDALEVIDALTNEDPRRDPRREPRR